MRLIMRALQISKRQRNHRSLNSCIQLKHPLLPPLVVDRNGITPAEGIWYVILRRESNPREERSIIKSLGSSIIDQTRSCLSSVHARALKHTRSIVRAFEHARGQHQRGRDLCGGSWCTVQDEGYQRKRESVGINEGSLKSVTSKTHDELSEIVDSGVIEVVVGGTKKKL